MRALEEFHGDLVRERGSGEGGFVSEGKGRQNPSDTRRVNALTRMIDEHGAAQTARLLVRALRERSKSDPMAWTIADHLLVGIIRAEAEELEKVAS